MRKTITKDIDGINYEFGQMSATKALKWFKRLQDVLLPAIGKGLGAVSKGADIDGEALGSAFQTLSTSVSETQYDAWVKDLLEGVVRNNIAINFDIDFQGQILHLHKLLAAILEANFSDFLGVFKGKSAGLMSKLQGLSQS